ncbi:hypothetical protein OAU55_00105 [Candidatus Pelagibacter sp.]|jgi:hypothetical protein|nr:hypothetical protein [Candidatus Pelagibacter sp.]|tara:strand:- start:11 stop:1201 length:1191 start_codon:yes stop_codon:yes gene_type:complete
MGGFCTPTYTDLDSSSGTVAGTEIPEWVAAAGRGLFQEAAGIAGQDYPVFPGQDNRIADLTADELQGMNIMREGAENYLPYMNRAAGVADTLGGGYDAMSQQELLGDPFQGATREELIGDYQGATREDLIGQGVDPFSLENSQQYMDIYQSAMDPAVREIQEQTALAQNAARARAATGGGGFGSRLGIMEATTAGEGAQAAGDLRAQAAREGLGFAAGRYDQDVAQSERDRSARFGAEDVMRGQFERDRDARFGADAALRGQYDTDRQSRFGADTQARQAYETNEASRIQQMDAYQGMAPLVQDLQRQAAAGLVSSGEAQRQLDQQALDLAYADFVDQRDYDKQQLNFALGALSGTPYNTINRSYTTGSQMSAQPSLFGQALAGAGGLYSAYKMAR